MELPKEIQRARELGDLRENAEYQAAKERQTYVNARIAMLKRRMSEIALMNMDRIPHGKAGFGSTVTLREKDQEIVYQLVMPEDADAEKGLISTSSPIGRAILNKEEGDEVTSSTPDGTRRFEILKLVTIHDEVTTITIVPSRDRAARLLFARTPNGPAVYRHGRRRRVPRRRDARAPGSRRQDRHRRRPRHRRGAARCWRRSMAARSCGRRAASGDRRAVADLYRWRWPFARPAAARHRADRGAGHPRRGPAARRSFVYPIALRARHGGPAVGRAARSNSSSRFLATRLRPRRCRRGFRGSSTAAVHARRWSRSASAPGWRGGGRRCIGGRRAAGCGRCSARRSTPACAIDACHRSGVAPAERRRDDQARRMRTISAGATRSCWPRISASRVSASCCSSCTISTRIATWCSAWCAIRSAARCFRRRAARRRGAPKRTTCRAASQRDHRRRAARPR